MMGALIGDIAGSEYEVYNPQSYDFELLPPAATFTDDSVLTCATAAALQSDKNFAGAYLHWFRDYRSVVGFGPRFVAWGDAGLTRGSPAPPYQSWGNGSAMRVSPIGWLPIDLDGIRAAARASALPTHDHPEAVLGAEAVAACIAIALRSTPEGRKDALVAVVDALAPTYDLTTTIAQRIDRDQRNFDVSCRGCVPVAIRAVIEATSFEQAIRLAIWHGGDTDTLAAIAGSIAEAVFGIPPALQVRFRSRLDDRISEAVFAWERTMRQRSA